MPAPTTNPLAMTANPVQTRPVRMWFQLLAPIVGFLLGWAAILGLIYMAVHFVVKYW